MKLSLIFILNVLKVFSSRFKTQEMSLSLALEDLTSFMIKSNQELAVTNYDQNLSVFDVLPIEKLKFESVPMRIKKEFEIRKQKIGESKILFFNSMLKPFVWRENSYSLSLFNSEVEFINTSPIKLFYFVYCKHATVNDLNEISKEYTANFKFLIDTFVDINNIFHYEYFIIDEENVIKLLTFNFYTPQACNIPQLIEVNRTRRNGIT